MNLEAPVLVAGLDHSGKTSLRIALGQHPSLVLVRRLALWTDLRARHARATRLRRPSFGGLP